MRIACKQNHVQLLAVVATKDIHELLTSKKNGKQVTTRIICNRNSDMRKSSAMIIGAIQWCENNQSCKILSDKTSECPVN